MLDISIEEHAVASRFPKPTNGPSIQPIAADLLQFAVRPDFPKTLKECIRQDAPQMSLHVTSFSDATIVGLTWPHTMMDALGHEALLRSWSLVLAGRENEVPPMLGTREDVLVEADREGEREELKLESKRLVGIGAAKLLSRFMWDKIRNPAPETRMVYVPKEFIARLHVRAQREAAEDAQGIGKDAFVSEGDVLTAWATRIMASSQMGPRPITIASFLNARFRVPRARAEGVYAQNMTLITYTFLSPQAAKGSVGSIALAHRRHLVEQATEQQVMSFVRSVHRDIEAGKSPRLLFGDRDSVPLMFNNLIKADLIKGADFAPAVLREGEKAASRLNPPGSMTSYYNQALNKDDKLANAFYMLAKDHGGNYWLMGSLLPAAWTTLEKELQKM